MKIEDIDKNFASAGNQDEDKTVEYSILEKPFSLYGIFFDNEKEILENQKTEERRFGCFARMPWKVSRRINYNIDWLASNTTGGRIKFSTDSSLIGISVKWDSLIKMGNMPTSASSSFALLEETDDGRKFIKNFIPKVSDDSNEKGFTETIDVYKGFKNAPKKVRNYIIFCPLYNGFITDIKVILEKKAKVGEGKKYLDKLPIIYYGSSITEGGCVSRADNTYTAFVEKWTNVDFVNLGFSGSAKGEASMADYIGSQKASIFVYDYDHNAPTIEYLKTTHYNFYKTYRKHSPNTPIIFVSRPITDANVVEADERFGVINQTYKRAKKEGDKNVYLVDGRKFYPDAQLGENCHVDCSHPNDLGHYFMAKKIYSVIKKIL